MRRGANKIFFLAVLGSLAVHVVLASVGERVIHVGGWAIPFNPPAEMTVILPDEIKEPEKPEEPKPPELDRELLLGEANASGYASFRSPGLREQLARQADEDQAFLSRDPRGTGTGGESAAPEGTFNASATAPPSESASMADARDPVFGPASPVPLPRAARPKEAVDAPPKVGLARANSDRAPLPVAEIVPAKTDDPKVIPAPTDEPRPAIAAPAPPPSPPQPALSPAAAAQAKQSADPAPQTDSEVDPFSTLGSVDFREGSLAVRAGRQIKPRRPKFTLAGQVALLQVQSPRVELAVTTDAAGKVTSTEILKSSGSIDIDQPVRVSLYDWWFEPKKDANGRPLPDRFRFTVGFH